MAPFKSIGQAAVMVLARQSALNLVKDELRRKGQRADMRELYIAADALLRERPELIEQAMQRAWRLALTNQQGRIAKALFDDERRARPPVAQSGSARAGTEKTQLFP